MQENLLNVGNNSGSPWPLSPILPLLLLQLSVTKTPLWMDVTKNAGLPCPPAQVKVSLWEGQAATISHEPLLHGADTTFQASTARRSEIPFLYPASTDRAEALPQACQTQNPGALVSLP